MRGDNNKKVGDVIRKLMKNPKLADRLDKLDVLYAWEEMIGPALCKYIIDQKVYKGILYVKLRSAVVRNELSYKKSEFIREINQKLGRDLISDIILK